MRVTNFIIILFIILPHEIISQSLAERVQAKQMFCDTNLPDSLVSPLKETLNELEAYFIKEGLLKDGTGKSYYAVYKKMAVEGDLDFKVNISFPLLDTLDFKVLSQCFYKVLSPTEIAEVSLEHLEASEQALASMPTEINPGLVAKSFTDSFKESYYDLAFFRIGSLITFHNLSLPHIIEGLSTRSTFQSNIIDTLNIEVNSKDELTIEGSLVVIDKLHLVISDFLVEDLTTKGIRLKAHRGSSYEIFVKILQIINEKYREIRDDLANTNFNKAFDLLSDSEKKKIKDLVPNNLMIDEPSQNE